MSSKELRAWMRTTKASPVARHVFVVLHAHLNPKKNGNRVWPSIGLLAEETGWSERAIQRALRELEDVGAVALEARAGHSTVVHLSTGGDSQSPRHTVTPDSQSQRGATQSQRGDSQSPRSFKERSKRSSPLRASHRPQDDARSATNNGDHRDPDSSLPATIGEILERLPIAEVRRRRKEILGE